MTVSSTTTKNSYSGDGSTTTFAYAFKIFADADLTVILRSAAGTETVQTLTTDYTVTNAGNASGGNVEFVTAPASGVTVVIRRNMAQTQSTDYVANDPFPAATHEDALDRLTFIAQQQQEEVDRSIKLSRTNTMTSTEFTVGATDRANKVLAFDGNGELSVTQELGTYKGTDATVTTEAYVVRDIIKSTTAGQLNNVYICVADAVVGDLLTDTDHFELLVDAVTAATSATNAASSASAAATSESNAATSESNAATSASNAATSESNASTSETNAATSATSASNSATSAATSATTATTKASEASTSATNAATSESNASTSATNAATSATNASTSETNAATSATTATTQASAASTSASNAATSASNASTSETNAAASAAAAAASADTFDDTYLGSKSSDPSVDNDGDALNAGDLYFNTTSNTLKVYTGSAWQDAAIDSSGFVQTTGDTMTGDLNLGDNDKAIFGAGSDLQIYHDPSDSNSSYIKETGAGDLRIDASNVLIRDASGNNYFKGAGTGAALLYHSGAEKLATTSTGIDVTGTATMDGLTVDGSESISITSTNGNTLNLYRSGTGADSVAINFRDGSNDRTQIKSSDGGLSFHINGTTRAVDIDSSGNVGIGISSPSATLHVAGDGSNPAVYIGNTTETNRLEISADVNGGVLFNQTDGGTARNIRFALESSEAMRIDSSGNLLVGKTSSDSGATAGLELQSNGDAYFTRDTPSTGYTVMRLNRLSYDGDILQFRKDGSAVGSIGVSSSDNLFIEGAVASHAGLTFGTNQIIPLSQGGSGDNTVDLGNNGNYFKDVLVKGGIRFGTNTSANYLDDYEEGTFDPTVFIGATEVTSYHFQNGSYTKVGRMVHLNLWFRVNNKGAATGNISIRGLPFAVPNSSDFNTAATVGYQDEMASSSAPIMAYAVKNTSQINLNYTTATGRTPITEANLNNGQMMIQVSYPTT